MSYATKQAAKNFEITRKIAGTEVIPTFFDQRASTAAQLKQQQMMHIPHEATHAVQQKQGRVQSTIQLMQQAIINNSALVSARNPLQLLATKGVVQAKTQINYGPLKTFTFQAGNMTQPVAGEVGSLMVAELDPKDSRTGTDTGGSNAYNGLFGALQNNTKSTWVRGHLLNHDLGGVAHYNNLFPLTTAANGEHYQEVEKQVKHWVANNNNVHYEVNAYQFGTDGTGRFDCFAYPTSGKHHGDVIKKTIHSLPQRTDSTQQYQHKKDKAAKKFSSVEIHNGNSVKRDTYKNEKYKTSSSWKHKSGSTGVNNKSLTASLDETDMQIDFSGDEAINEALLVQQMIDELTESLKTQHNIDADPEDVEDIVTTEDPKDWIQAYIAFYGS